LSEPKNVLQSVVPWPLLAGLPGLSRVLAFAARRWIGVNQGCDSNVELEQPPGGINGSPELADNQKMTAPQPSAVK
jgi:hypothetical protein